MRQVPAHEGLPVALALAVAQRLVGGQLIFLETIVGKDTGETSMADEDGPGARARKACAMPTQFNAAPKLASGNSAMVGLALRVN